MEQGTARFRGGLCLTELLGWSDIACGHRQVVGISLMLDLNHACIALQVRLASRKVLNFCSVYSGELARLHLALFYIYGVYYQWPKRLTGESF